MNYWLIILIVIIVLLVFVYFMKQRNTTETFYQDCNVICDELCRIKYGNRYVCKCDRIGGRCEITNAVKIFDNSRFKTNDHFKLKKTDHSRLKK
jgi:hypothetical protein